MSELLVKANVFLIKNKLIETISFKGPEVKLVLCNTNRHTHTKTFCFETNVLFWPSLFVSHKTNDIWGCSRNIHTCSKWSYDLWPTWKQGSTEEKVVLQHHKGLQNRKCGAGRQTKLHVTGLTSTDYLEMLAFTIKMKHGRNTVFWSFFQTIWST